MRKRGGIGFQEINRIDDKKKGVITLTMEQQVEMILVFQLHQLSVYFSKNVNPNYTHLEYMKFWTRQSLKVMAEGRFGDPEKAIQIINLLPSTEDIN